MKLVLLLRIEMIEHNGNGEGSIRGKKHCDYSLWLGYRLYD